MADGPRRHGFPVCREPHLNTLSSVWYCTAGLALSIYVVAGSVQRFTRYMSLPWPSRDQPYVELNAYVAFIGAGVVLLPFFVASAVLQVGNMSNDAATVGGELDEAAPAADPAALYENLPRRARRRPGSAWGGALRRWLKAAWRHGGPTAATLHVWSAFCLLAPRALMHARLIRHGFLRRADVWHTDLDFVVPHRERLVPLGQLFVATVNESELWERDTQEPGRPPPINHLDVTGHVSAEFVNYAFALLVYSARYPAVFWKRNKGFALLFSLYLVYSMVGLKLLTLAAVGIVHGVHVVGERDLLHRFGPLRLNAPATLGLYFVYTVLVTASGSLVYSCGLLKYSEWKSRTALKHHITWQGAQAGGITFYGHGPHVHSLLVLAGLVMAGGPLLADLIRVYQASLDGVLLLTVAAMLGHVVVWVAMWALFTFKHEWNFCAENGPLSEHPMSLAGTAGAAGGHHHHHQLHQQYGHHQPVQQNGQGHIGYTPLLKLADGPDHPLLVVDNGQTYRVSEISSKKAILGLASRQQQVQKLPHPSEDEDIYWLKPRMASSLREGDQPTSSLSWLRSQKPKSYQAAASATLPTTAAVANGHAGSNASQHQQHKPKVTFSTTPTAGNTPRVGRRMLLAGNRNSAATAGGKTRKPPARLPDELAAQEAAAAAAADADDSTCSVVPSPGSLLRCADGSSAGQFYKGEGDLDPLTIDTQNPQLRGILSQQNGGTLSPTTLTPRSDCVSDASTSPEKAGEASSNDSNSSGVHSACSDQLKRTSSFEQLIAEVQSQLTALPPPTATVHQRSGSQPLQVPTWKSMSLQRTTICAGGASTTAAAAAGGSFQFRTAGNQPNGNNNNISNNNNNPLATTGGGGVYGDGTNSLVIRRNASNACDLQNRRPLVRLTSFTERSDFGLVAGPTRILPPTVPSLPSMPNFPQPPSMPPLPGQHK